MATKADVADELRQAHPIGPFWGKGTGVAHSIQWERPEPSRVGGHRRSRRAPRPSQW